MCWDPRLRVRCRPADPAEPDLGDLVRDMHRIMREERGVGLAAPQVGDDRRVILIRRPDDPPERARVLLNPEILAASEAAAPFEEGCLSFPAIYRVVRRPRSVRVRGLDLTGAVDEFEDDGILARVVQHEIDHLDGILFSDHLGRRERWGVSIRMALQRIGLRR